MEKAERKEEIVELLKDIMDNMIVCGVTDISLRSSGRKVYSDSVNGYYNYKNRKYKISAKTIGIGRVHVAREHLESAIDAVLYNHGIKIIECVPMRKPRERTPRTATRRKK